MTVLETTSDQAPGALSVSTVNHGIDRVRATFDDESLVANAGLLSVVTVVGRLGLEALINKVVRLGDRVGAAQLGRKELTLIHAMISGADCIDDTNRLRAGSTGAVLGHRVMAPSTLGTFLRAFTFGRTATRRCSDITRCSPPAPTPARSSTPDFAKALRTPPEGSCSSSTSSCTDDTRWRR